MGRRDNSECPARFDWGMPYNRPSADVVRVGAIRATSSASFMRSAQTREITAEGPLMDSRELYRQLFEQYHRSLLSR